MSERQLNYRVYYTVDRSGLIELKQELKDLQSMTLNDLIRIDSSATTSQLGNIKKSAKEIEDALKKAFNADLGTVNVTKFNQELKKLNIDKIYKDLSSAGTVGRSAFRTMANEAMSANVQLKQSHQLLDNFATSMKNSIKWGITSNIFNKMSDSIQNAWAFTKALDTSLNDIRIVSGKSADEMERFAKQANNAAQSLGKSTRDYTEASLIYYQQGLSDEEVAARTETTLKAANVTGQKTSQVSEQLTAVWNGYRVTAAETEKYIDKLAAVAASTAADLEELSTGMSKVAAAANVAGVDFDQLNAILSTVISVTREAPETIGSSFKTIFARLGDLAIDGEDDFGVTLGKVSGQMEKLGIQILDEQGNMVKMGTIIEETAKKWKGWTEAQKQAAAVAMGGKMQYSRLITLFENWDKYGEALTTSADSLGTLQEQQDIYMESTQAHLEQLSTAWERVFDAFSNNESMNDLIDVLTDATNTFANFIESIGGGGKALLTLGAIATNVFQKQIGDGLATTVTNIRLAAENTKEYQAVLENINQFEKSDEASKDSVIQQMIANVKELHELQGSLGVEEQKSTQELYKQLNMLLEKRQSYTEEKQHQEEILKALTNQKANIDEINNASSQTNKLYNKTKTEIAELVKLLETIKTRSGKDGINNLFEKGNENKLEAYVTDLQRLKELLNNINTTGKIPSLEKNKFFQDLNSVNITKYLSGGLRYYMADARNYSTSLTDIQKQAGGLYQEFLNIPRTIDKINKDLEGTENQLQDVGNNVDEVKKKFKDIEAGQTFAKLLSGITSAFSVLSTISSIGDIITNENLTGWEKFLQIGMNVTTTISILVLTIKNLKDGLTGLKPALIKVAADMITTSEAESIATASTMTFDKAISILLGRLGTLIATIAPYIIGITAITLAINAVTKSINAENDALKTSQEDLKNLQQEYQNINSEYQNIKTTLDGYDSTRENIDKMVRQTREWKDAVFELNQQMIELMSNHPEYAKYLQTNKDGIIEFVEGGQEAIIKDQQEQINIANRRQLSSQINTLKAQNAKSEKDLAIKGIGSAMVGAGLGGGWAALASSILASSATTAAVGSTLGPIGTTLGLVAGTVIGVQDFIEKNTEAINESTKTTEENNQQISLLYNQIARSYGEQYGGEAYQSSEFKDIIDEDNARQIEERTEEILNSIYDPHVDIGYGKISTNIGTNFGSSKADVNAWLEKNRYTADGFFDIGSWAKNKLNYLDEEGNSHSISLDTIRRELATDIAAQEQDYDIRASYLNNANQALSFIQNEESRKQFIKSLQKGNDIDFSLLTKDELDKFKMVLDANLFENAFLFQKGFGYKTNKGGREKFDKAYDTYIEDIDISEYQKRAKESSDSAVKTKSLIDVLTTEGYDNVQSKKEFEEQYDWLEKLEEKYIELQEMKDKDSYEYFHALEQAQEQYEEESKNQIEDAIEIQKEKIVKILEEGGTEGTERLIEELGKLNDLEYDLELKVKLDVESDVDSGFGLAEKFADLEDLIKNKQNDLLVSYQEAQELIAKGYGAMLENSKKANEQMIALDKATVNAFIDGKQSELEADRKQKIELLQREYDNYTAQIEAKEAQLEALKAALVTEDKAEKASYIYQATLAQQDYEDQITKLNEITTSDNQQKEDLSENAEELYNTLSDMYKTDAKNDEMATESADNAEQAHANNVINYYKAMHGAVQQYAKAKIAAANNEEVADWTETSAEQTEMISTDEPKQETIVSDYSGTDGKQTVKNLIDKNTIEDINAALEQEINALDNQIQGLYNARGSIAGSITALQSASSSLDYAQGHAGEGKNNKSSNKPDHEDNLENEIDRYHDINIILKQIETELGRLQSQQDKLFGQNLIDNLNKQLQLLDEQIDATNEKIGIANGEVQELQNKLTSRGITFNPDNTIANYALVYQQQLDYVNSIIDNYNNMTKDAQESYKSVVEQAKKDFEKFQSDLSKYDDLVSETIPGLQDEIQEAIDKEIEIKITEFNMEIGIRLDLSEAERDWNEFKRKVIDSIKDDDILGNTRARLQDFSSYYKMDNTGEIQALTQQVLNTKAQLEQIDKTGTSNWYGDNRTQALEDLKNYTDQLMKSLGNVEDLVQEIKDSYLDMMDEAAEKFGDQIDLYEQVRDIITHDMNVIELIYGEESYKDLEKYYEKQEDNYNKQLDFNKQQKDFWYNQMIAIEKAGGKNSETWLKAKENWLNAVNEWNSAIEDAIENLQDKYQNAINLIFQGLNDKVTDGLGLEYVSEEWELINQNADQYLDTINSLYGIQDLENKYLDAIDNTDSISAQRQLNELMEQEVSALKEKDKLTQYDIDRANMKYEIALKQIALEEAQQNKSTMRLRRDSQGNYTYQYVADDDQVGQIEDELAALKNELYNFDLEHYRDNLDQVLSIWTEFQEKMAEAALINDPEERQERELLLREQYGELINGLVEQNEDIRMNLHESAFTELADLYNIEYSNFQQLSDEEKQIMMEQMIPQWDSAVQHMTDTFAGNDEGEGGFLPTCRDAFKQLDEITKQYQIDLGELEQSAGTNFENIKNGIDENIGKTQELIVNNDELIRSYQDQLSAIGAIISELQQLVSQYNAAKNAAIAATEAAYGYWKAQQQSAANAAGRNTSGEGSSLTSGSINSNSANTNSNNSNKSNSKTVNSGGGNTNEDASIGNKITYSGTYYYDSFGTSPVGSKYSGIADGVTIDIVNNNPYGIHIKSSDGKYPDLGWIKKSQVTRWNTGGYTGDWGDNSGRLAILDRKELVLNKEDTPNILNAVEIMRGITNSMNLSMLSRIAGSISGIQNSSNPIAADTDTLEQNVHIDATFPGVKDAREIEQALNNLVNVASQRVGHNRR